MKILFLVSSLQGGGAERVATLLSNAWVERGHHVNLMPTFSGGGACHYHLDERVVVDYLSDHVRGNANRIGRLRLLRKFIQRTSPDIVVSFLPHVNVAALIATLGTRIPVIACERTYPPLLSPPLPRSYEIARKLLYPKAARIGVQTQLAGDWVKAHIPRSKVDLIANPVAFPLPVVEPVRQPDSILPSSKKVVLAAGRLDEMKRFDVLIQAFQKAASTSDWNLVILGEGPLLSDLSEQAAATGLSNRIHFPGFAGNPAEWYLRADIFAMSSAYEGFPNVLLEAMAHGLPTISFDIKAGPRDLTDKGRRGILLPDRDHNNSLSHALRRLIHSDEERRQLGRLAEEVREVYSLEVILNQWDNCLEQAIAGKGGS